MRIIIAGSRNMTDYSLMKLTWTEYIQRHGLKAEELTIISGGAAGADKLAERLAKETGIACRIMKADWEAHGKSAGQIRNNAMAKAAGPAPDGRLLAYWDGESPGTEGMIRSAKRAGLHVEIVRLQR
jgi:hypothetical protein